MTARALKSLAPLLPLALTGLLVACGGGEESGNGLSGSVLMDGSSTVFPISEAVAEEFLAVAPRVRVTVGVSGTGGGFKQLIAGEIDIANASRHISASERLAAEQAGRAFIELPVAFDGLSVVVNTANDWVDQLSVEELKQIWQPGSTVDSWNDVRPEWPDRPIRLYGPGTDSGTFDYWTEAIMGEPGASRPDYTASEDDNVLVTGVNGDENALGFFGYAYYQSNQDSLRLVPVDGGNGPVQPTPQTINDGSYSPLSRPVFIYASVDSLQKPAVVAFTEFYLENAGVLANEVGYIELRPEQYEAALEQVRQAAGQP